MKTTLFSSTQGDIPCDLAFKNNFAGLAAPTANDDAADGYQVGSQWVYAGNTYSCVDATAGAAVWNLLGQNDITNPIAGIAAGYKVARGVAAITGTGTVVTGLATVVAVIATSQDDLDGTTLAGVSATIGNQSGAPAAGSVILKAWKITAADNGALIAATAAKNINWVAIGT